MRLKLLNEKNSKLEQGMYGTFVTFVSDTAYSEKCFDLTVLEGMKNFTATYRWNACWLAPLTGNKTEEIPEETIYLITFDGNKYNLIYALIDGVSRSAMFSESGKLCVVCETGDEATKVTESLALYIIEGDDPYELNRLATEDIVTRLGTCRLLKDKIIPKYADLLGFCSYNAFYDKVSEKNLTELLEVFKANQLDLGFILLDAGWQDYNGNYTHSFAADPEKFPNGLKATVSALKENYGIKEVLCWHTYNGYWCGLDKDAFPEYKFYQSKFHIPERIKRLMGKIELSDSTATAGFNFFPMNLVDEYFTVFENDLFRFYFDMYSYLRNQGVDGSKLDAICWIEAFGQGKGGRVKAMRELVSGLEAASSLNFDMEHINCSSCSNDFIYNTLKSSVIRSSTDYFENIPESHGLHLYTNAHTSFWLADILMPDWDMFQSGNTAGDYHAMARAISGGPIYTSDNLKSVNFDTLKKLATLDGRLGRCISPARVTKDCIFVDPIKQNKLLKVFNQNRYNYVLGAFNCCYDPDKNIVSKSKISIDDIYNIKESNFVVYQYGVGIIGKGAKDYSWQAECGRFEGLLYTVTAIKDGFALIGMTQKYNPGGFVEFFEHVDNEINITLKEAGEFSAYCVKSPKSCNHEYSYVDKLLTVKAKTKTIEIQLWEYDKNEI